jgi:hypothetical protein
MKQSLKTWDRKYLAIYCNATYLAANDTVITLYGC